jgi:phenylalanyl-tRNA synthetase beta chain
MKVSLNWLRDYLDLHKTPQEIADILTSTGLEVDGWETIKPSPVDLDKVKTGRVIACERIPETDHLSATQVEVGEGIVQSIVCGAPNVAVGQKVFVAMPGANVYSKDGQLFQIGERKVKGIPSHGMICAEDELGLGQDHAGILVLPPETPIGISAAHYFNQKEDVVIEIGLTPNRADATNHLGVALDIAAYLRIQEGQKVALKRPQDELKIFNNLPIYAVEVENLDSCPRYTGLLITGVTVKESPDWIKNRLTAIGQRPINNIVDITNYVRAELGQPLHAFDASEIKGNKIVVKNLAEGTVFQSLDEVNRKLFAEDLMICDAENNPMCIGGVFGGATSGVKDNTTSIFLESAFFNSKSIRRSMLKHNLRTDAAWCFEKGVNPNGCLDALIRATSLILELAGGELASKIVDIYPNPILPARIPVSYNRVDALIGQNIDNRKVRAILEALEIGIEDKTDKTFTAVIPTNKPDVLREADVIEEILRIYGLDTVPIPTQIRASVEVTQSPSPEQIRNTAAEFLCANGFNECMSLSLSNSTYFKDILPIPMETLVFVHNTANQGLDCMRPTLLFNGLESIRHNQNRQNPDVRLFEFGKSYQRNGEKFNESLRLSILMTGTHSSESWQKSSKQQVDFYTLKSYVQNLLNRFGVTGFQETVLQPDQNSFQFALKYHRGEAEIVTFGKVKSSIVKKMDIKNEVYFADFNWDSVQKTLKNNKTHYKELNKFPIVRRDLALVIDKSLGFGEIKALAGKTAKKLLKEVNLFDVFQDESKLGEGKKSYAVSFIFEDTEKTLQDKEIDAAMTQLQQAFEQKMGAQIRK